MLILLIDDDATFRMRMVAQLQKEGHEVLVANDGTIGLRLAMDSDPDLVLVDQMMEGISGDEVVATLHRDLPDVPAVVVTGLDSPQDIVKSLQAGAFDYLTKPVDMGLLGHVLRRVQEHQSLLTQKLALEEEVRQSRGSLRMETANSRMRAIVQQAEQVARTDATVLITGENGTGKDLLARHIQQLGQRADRPFVIVNCGALPEQLLESELFGHAKGAFTGATRQRRGYLEAADGGTLFLDEVAEISPTVQVKLLRFLQEREFVRVGETEARTADVRVLAATNRDLAQLLEEGRLREDFYYRLNVFRLHLLPLRERPEDISGLFQTMVTNHARRLGRPVPDSAPDLLSALRRHPWPGNIRELDNLAERLTILCSSDVLNTELLPEEFLGRTPTPTLEKVSYPDDYREARQQFENAFFSEQLRRHDGNMAATARTIGLHPVYFRQKVAQLGIRTGRKGG